MSASGGRKPPDAVPASKSQCRLCRANLKIQGTSKQSRNLFKLKVNSQDTVTPAARLETVLGRPIRKDPSLSDIICQSCFREIPRMEKCLSTMTAWQAAVEGEDRSTPTRVRMPAAVCRTPQHRTQKKRGLSYTPGKSPLHKQLRPADSVENIPPKSPPHQSGETLCNETRVEVHVKRPSDKKPRVCELSDKELPLVRHITGKKWGQAAKDIMGHDELAAELKKQVGTTILKEGKSMAPTSILGQTSCEDLKKLSIADVKEEIEREAPWTAETLRAICGYRSGGRADVAVVTAASILLRVPYPTLSALQYRNSFVLLQAGAKKVGFQRLNRQQMCMSHKRTIIKQQEAGISHDKKVLEWKRDIEHFFQAQRILETLHEVSAEREALEEKAMLDKSGGSSFSTISFADLSSYGFSVQPSTPGSPGNLAVSPGNLAVSPGNLAVSPGNPGNLAVSPGKPGNLAVSPGNPGNLAVGPGNLAVSPANTLSVTPRNTHDVNISGFCDLRDMESWEDCGVGLLQVEEEPVDETTLADLVPGYAEGAYGLAEKVLQSTSSPCIPPSSTYSTATIQKAISSISTYYPPWYQLIFDNLDFIITAKHQGHDDNNKNYHWVHQGSFQDRVSSNLPNSAPQKALADFDLADVLPTEDIQQELRRNYIILIARVMVKYIPAFHSLKDVAVWHIPHQYEEEMSKKSEQVWLGLQFKNENLSRDMADILKYFHKYVPAEMDEDGRLVRLLLVILLGGDWLSQERADSVQGAFRDGDDPLERLEGVLGKFELWHSFKTLYGTHYGIFYKQDSAADKASLCSNMNVTRSLNAKKGPHLSYNPYKEFNDLETNAAILCTCKVEFGWESLDVPEETVIPQLVRSGDRHIRRDWLHKKAAEVVDRFIMSEDSATLTALETSVKSAAVKPQLPCRHPGCPKVYVRAGCRVQHEKDKHGLEADESHTHPTTTQTSTSTSQDYVYNYNTANLSMSLLIRNLRDATKEGDGERISNCFRAALLYFKAYGHTKYAFGTLLFFARVNALLPPRLAHSLVWNRVVNNKGGKGRNIPMDLRLEHMNAFLKSFLRHLGPNLNEKSATRIARAIGVMEEILEQADRDWAVAKPSGYHHKKDPRNDIDILYRQFVSAGAFEYQAGRQYEHFPQFDRNLWSKLNPTDFAKWMKKKLRQWQKIYE
ncbi:PREDICTED: uncharacterized protein LOC109485103 [Branchiostoma belcheri]|uniref:Uncharacterized protein LOC109485103 n=1 Tax=Branchiostoma belcheri TaxID=7741 RepID=A0A6P5APY0_BRABE|nr:PREDICTED: uncharacterized protein LOC109485103 [Branchiostoma belcheri]